MERFEAQLAEEAAPGTEGVLGAIGLVVDNKGISIPA